MERVYYVYIMSSFSRCLYVGVTNDLLKRVEEHCFELRNADLHDLRDTDTSRENYVAASVATGIKRNRKRVILFRSEVVAISLLTDVTHE